MGFGGVRYERETGNCFMVPIENRNATTLLAIIKEWIKPGTTIISNCWKAYNTLNNEGYIRMTVNHSYHFKDLETGVHSNTIESLWRHSKAAKPLCPTTVVKKNILCWILGQQSMKVTIATTAVTNTWTDDVYGEYEERGTGWPE
ncbi:Uncharacterized protein FWK35_00006393 [Aphis craccivora]|uniref:ISXO2-like transposase domain-containing protein n=1 Tax=Aphis craccivora TaxID=307492 RepID=A0A6G0ZPA3_APHCR|nr:Uncharacterized protein FWK35_00006393 [Aphis craccivora]